MERTRQYYRALGYETDYVWATNDDVPFTRLSKPLENARIALVTTALPPHLADARARGDKQVWSLPAAQAPAEFATGHVAWDKESTHTRDREAFLPIDVTNDLASDGLIAGLTVNVHGVPTVYSQNQTIERDAPAVWRRINEDGADAVLLAPL